MRLQKVLKGYLRCLVVISVAVFMCGELALAENQMRRHVDRTAGSRVFPNRPINAKYARGANKTKAALKENLTAPKAATKAQRIQKTSAGKSKIATQAGKAGTARKLIRRTKVDTVNKAITAPKAANEGQKLQRTSAGKTKLKLQSSKATTARKLIRRTKVDTVNKAITAPAPANKLQRVQKADAGKIKMKSQANKTGLGKRFRGTNKAAVNAKPGTQVRVKQKKGLVANLQGLKRQVGNALKRGGSTTAKSEQIKRMPLTKKGMLFQTKDKGLSVNKPAGTGLKAGSTSGPSFTSVEGTIRK